MITEAQWYQHPSFQTDLKALLDNPVLQAAIEICRDQELIPFSTNKAVNLIDFVAIMGSKREGYKEFLINLRGLAQPKRPSVPETKAWTMDPNPPETPTPS